MRPSRDYTGGERSMDLRTQVKTNRCFLLPTMLL